MNRLLIAILDILNKLLAIFVVVSSTVSGYYGEFAPYVEPYYHGVGYRALTTLVGFIVGVIVAALVSGVLATIITICREIIFIRELLYSRPVFPQPHR